MNVAQRANTGYTPTTMRIKVRNRASEETWFFESDHGLPTANDVIIKGSERFLVLATEWEVAVVGTKAAVTVIVDPT